MIVSLRRGGLLPMFNKLAGLFKKEEKAAGPKATTFGSYDAFGTWIGSTAGQAWMPDPIYLGRVWKKEEVIKQKYWVRDHREMDRGIMYEIRYLPWNSDIAVISPYVNALQGDNMAKYRKACEQWIGLGVHPTIITAYFMEEVDEMPRLILQIPPAWNLKEWILEKEVHTFVQALEVAMQICVAMDFIHQKNMIYRGLRPENIFISEDNRLKLFFPGLPRKVGEITAQEADPVALKKLNYHVRDGDVLTGEVIGFPLYMAPELWTMRGEGSREADIYAFGAILFELMSYSPPFALSKTEKRAPLLAYKMMHLYDTPPDLHTIKSETPRLLVDLVHACLSKEPGKRPRSFREILLILRKSFHEICGREALYYPIPEEMLEPDNINNKAMVLVGEKDEKNEKGKEALGLLKDLMKKYPTHPEGKINLEVLKFEQGEQTKEATILRLQDLITSNVDKKHLGKVIMWAMVQGGEMSHVNSLLDRADPVTKESAWLQNMKGILLQKMESPSQSLTAFEKAIAQESFRWEYLYNLGVAWFRQGKQEEAEAFFEKAAGLSSDPRITVAHSIVFSVKGKTKETEEILLDAFRRMPESFWVTYHLGALMGSMGLRVPGFDSHGTDLERATQYLAEAMKYAPGLKRIRDAYVECARRTDKKVELPSLLFRDPPSKEEREMGTLWKVRCYRTLREHKEQVTSIAVSWNGRYAVSGGSDDMVVLWDPLSGRSLAMLRGHQDMIRAVSISADGSLALSGSKDGTLRLWQVPGGQCLQVLKGHEGEVYGARVSYDGNIGISGGEDRTVRVWDLRSGECRMIMKGHRSRVTAVTISYDAKYALSGSIDRTLRLWDLSTGSCMKTLKGHEGEILSVAMTADGKFAISGGSDGIVRLWDLDQNLCIRVLEGHSKEVFSVDISPDVRFGLSGGFDETVRLWDLGLGECISVLGGHQGSVFAVAMLPDGRFGLSGSRDKTVRMWEWVEEMIPLINSVAPYALASSERAQKEIAAEALYRDLMKKAREALYGKDAKNAYGYLRNAMELPNHAKDPDAFTLIGDCAKAGGTRQALRAVWCSASMEGHNDWVLCAAIDGGNQFGLSGGSDTNLRLWDLSTGECVRTLTGHGREVTAVSISLDGKYALSANRDQSLRLWSPADGQCLQVMKGHTHDVTSAVLSHDAKFAMSGSLDNTVRLWEMASGKCLGVLSGSDAVIYAVAFSADYRVGFSVGADRTLRLWDLVKGSPLKELKGHNSILRCVAASATGGHCLTGGEDGKVCLWDLSKGEVIQTLEGHEGEVTSVSLTGEGRFALSTGGDRTVRLWDLSSGKNLKVLREHKGAVSCASFSPDGSHFISGSYDETVKAWKLDWDWAFD
jgi:WD40 repeat protein/serine/threonine protein kinase